MKHTQKWCLLFLILVLCCAVSTTPAWAADLATRQQAAATAGQKALSYGGATSLQYALVEDGAVTISGGTGIYSRTENRALTDDILYGIGSVSKMYTTAAVLKLVEQGKVVLDAPVTRYLPDFKMASEDYGKITVRMLLNHSSGLLGSTMRDSFLFADGDDAATTTLLQELSLQRLKADPGAYSVYCNDGFTLAELLVEQVSGQSFTDFLKQYITGPLDLDSTFTPKSDFDRNRLAKIYFDNRPQPLPTENVGIIGTGGIYATAADLARFGFALCPGEGSILSQNSLTAMSGEEYRQGIWPSGEEGLLGYGLGWDNVNQDLFAAAGIQTLEKGGDTFFYHGGLVVIPQYQMAAAVVSSGGVSIYDQMVAYRLLIDALAAKGIAVPETTQTLPVSAPASLPEDLLNHAGLYASSAFVIRVELEQNGTLAITTPMTPQVPAQIFTYHTDGTFRDSTNSTMLQFVKEKNGKTYLYQKGYTELPGLGQVCSADYGYEKLPERQVEPSVQAAWQARKEKLYLLLNEKYSSQLFLLQFPVTQLPVLSETPGYLMSMAIVDEDHAQSVVRIPGTAGRDCQDLTIQHRNNLEYVDCAGSLFVESAAVQPLSPGAFADCTILPDGFIRWYRTGVSGGKTMTVTVPPKGGFYVYDAKGTLVASSYLYGDTQVTLPKDGWIAFAGDVGQVFHLTLTAGTAQ